MSNLEEMLMDQLAAEKQRQKGPDEEEQAKALEEKRRAADEAFRTGQLGEVLSATLDARQKSIRDALAKVQEENAARAKNHAESKCTQILESIRVALEENEDMDEALEIVKEALGID